MNALSKLAAVLALVCSISYAQTATSRTLIAYAGTYSTTTNYHYGDMATASGVTYISVATSNLNNPVTNPSYWMAVGSPAPVQTYIAASVTASKSQRATFGDSIVFGTGPQNAANIDEPSLGFANQAMQFAGGSFQAYANGGDTSYDSSLIVNTLASPSLGSFYIGDTSFTNDTQQYGSDANHLKMGQRAYQGNLYRRLIPDSSKNFLQAATLAGFALDGATYQTAQGLVATSNGAAFATNVVIGPSGTLDGCYVVSNGNTATFTIAVGTGSGIAQADPLTGSTSWLTHGDGGATISTSHGATQFCAGFRIVGLPTGSQKVTVTQTAAGTVNFQWLGSPAAPSASNPVDIELDVPQLSSSSANYASTAAYQSIFSTVTGYAVADGTNLIVLGARAALGADPGTSGNFASDQVHPSTVGAALLASLADALAANAGVVVAPSVVGSVNGQLAIPRLTDVSKGFTLNPTASLDGSQQSWSGVQIHTRNTQGAVAWEGNIYTSVVSGHVFAQTSNAVEYSFCTWNRNSDYMNFNFPANQLTGCDAVFRGGSAWLGVNSNAQPAEIVASNTIVDSYYGSVGSRHLSANRTSVDPPAGTNRSSGVNISSPAFGIQAQRGSDSSNACASGDWMMSIPTSGANQPAVLKLSKSASCNNDPFTLDLTGATTYLPPPLTSASLTCSAASGGQLNYSAGASGTKDTVQVCAKDASNTFAWRAIY